MPDPSQDTPPIDPAACDRLTIERLFNGPPLAGPTIQGLKVSPDSSRVTFLRGRDTHKNRLDLWQYHLDSGRIERLVDAALLDAGPETLSDEEQARRERQRTAALSGILAYQFSPTGDAILFPLGGALFFCRLSSAEGTPIVEPIPTTGFPTDPTLSPSGTQVAYVQDQNLFVYDLASRTTHSLTSDGGGAVKNGMAEYVAQEEMDRDTGYWWSPDGRQIAYARVDESPVAEIERFEVTADDISTFVQRYPAAGEANAHVRIGIVALDSRQTRWLEIESDADVYVARVQWLPDARRVAIQRQSRDQKSLDLLVADATTGTSHIVLTETSDTWIDLNHELTFLRDRDEFIWASARDGFTHLYLYETGGRLIRQLTCGEWLVDDFRARAVKSVDEVRRQIYFSSTIGTPTGRQLCRVGLDGGPVTQVTRSPGIHSIAMAPDASFYVDRMQSSEQPLSVGVFDRDGQWKAWLLRNRLDASHPDAPYVGDNARCEFGVLEADDGQALHYRLFKPGDFDPDRRYPAILDVYGGPGVQRVLDHWTGDSFTQILTRAGYVVLQLDNRGSAARGTRFQSPLHLTLGQAEVADQVRGARWLGSHAFIDPQRLGVWGWSYGGYLTLMLMFKASGLFRAGMSGAPVTDWRLYDTHYTERYLSTPQANARGYDASSALTCADGLQGALLLMHGMADDNVLFQHTAKLLKRLQDLNKVFEVMLYPGAKHGLLRQQDGLHAYATILRFFDRHLKKE